MSEAEMQKIQNGLPGATDQCLGMIRFGGLDAMPSRRVDQCFKMTPSRHWQGLFGSDFELARFCPAPARACSYNSPGDNIWLTMGDGVRIDQKADFGSHQLYAIEFVGRRTLQRGYHGHLGGYDYEIIVDKLISLKPLARNALR